MCEYIYKNMKIVKWKYHIAPFKNVTKQTFEPTKLTGSVCLIKKTLPIYSTIYCRRFH